MTNNIEKFDIPKTEQEPKLNEGVDTKEVIQKYTTRDRRSVRQILEESKKAHKETREGIATEKIIDSLERDNTNRAINLLRKSRTIELIITNPEIQKLASEALGRKLSKTGDTGSAIGIAKAFNLPEQIIFNGVEQGLAAAPIYMFLNKATDIQKIFNLPEAHLKRAAYRQIAETTGSGNGYSNIDENYRTKFQLSEEEFRKAVEEGMLKRISSGDIDNMVRIKDKFGIADETLESPEFRKAAEEGMAWKLSCGEISVAIQIKDKLNLSEESIIDADKSGAKQFDKSVLIKYIPYLGENDIINLFPQTFKKIIATLSEEIKNDEDLADYFLENLNKYSSKQWTEKITEGAVTHYSVANKYINELENNEAVWAQQGWAQKILAQAKITIEKHQHGMEGFLEEDPFKNHPFRTTRSSMELGRIMSGKTTPEEQGLKLSKEAKETLQEINDIIIGEHNGFLESFQNNSSVPDEDKIALTDQSQSKVKMNNLLPNVRNFVGRYLAQIAEGDSEKLGETIVSQKDSIKRIIQEGYRRYLKIYEVDIPLYDKLYEEFDHWRAAGRYPMEVYLGRDGIYAYLGRRAQDATRRSKVGREKREQLRAEGEVVEINPKYLVYPRYFRDNINYETKREFLEQERISPNMDPLFYDTGYTGTIPEQIMRIMGFDQADTEERIRLLSAPSAKRRVKGIPQNARSEIIEYIEHNAKTENTAEGLLQDEKTGEIRHVARPTNPEEQFYFMMIKQAISRHYMVQERLHFEAPDSANFDSEDYYIRVRQEYADILPADFIKNPKQYFEQQGTLLKGSKGEGEYPDEEVLSFKLEDGTEVIAKRVELRKSKEARKEFMILIASKKAGLPTAEPVGFLSGKKEEDGSYLLMEKLEGYSGRKFEKYLQESDKFTEEQVSGIMKTVAEKLKDLAQMFRDQLNIDKSWRIKDTIIQFNEETGEVEDVIPIDWERVKTYDPNKPQKIDLAE